MYCNSAVAAAAAACACFVLLSYLLVCFLFVFRPFSLLQLNGFRVAVRLLLVHRYILVVMVAMLLLLPLLLLQLALLEPLEIEWSCAHLLADWLARSLAVRTTVEHICEPPKIKECNEIKEQPNQLARNVACDRENGKNHNKIARVHDKDHTCQTLWHICADWEMRE